MRELYVYSTNLFRIEYCVMRIAKRHLKKQSVRQAKLVRFSRYESCPAKD